MPSLKDETIGISANARSVAELEQTVGISGRLRDAKQKLDDAAEFRSMAGKLLVQMVSLEIKLVEAAIEIGQGLAKAATEDRKIRRDHQIAMDKRHEVRQDRLLDIKIEERKTRLGFKRDRHLVAMSQVKAQMPDNGVDSVDVPGFGTARVNDGGELELEKSN